MGDAPELVPVFFVECGEVGILFVVTLNKNTVAVEHGGAGGTPAVSHHGWCQILFPDQIAVEVIAEEPGGAEIGVDALPIGHRSFRGVGVLEVNRGSRPSPRGDLLPKYLA